MNRYGKIISVNISEKRGTVKTPVPRVEIVVGLGVEGDAHAGCDPIRQISLLAIESHEKMKAAGADVNPGDFGENITTEGLVLFELPVGTRLRVGAALFEVTKIGKECHKHCAIYQSVGDCVMPREGIFARALSAGAIKPGDVIVVEEI